MDESLFTRIAALEVKWKHDKLTDREIHWMFEKLKQLTDDYEWMEKTAEKWQKRWLEEIVR